MPSAVFYFAYGSNLDDQQLRSRCPGARPFVPAVLKHHALTFGGFSHQWDGPVASVIRARGSQVEGLLYVITASDLRALDRFEGYPFAYDRALKTVVDDKGVRRRAVIYFQPEEGFEPWPPSQRYFATLWQAYDRLGFDLTRLAAAAGIEHRHD